MSIRLEYGGKAATGTVLEDGTVYVSLDVDPGFGPMSFTAPFTASMSILSGDADSLARLADRQEGSTRFIGHEGTRQWYREQVEFLRELAEVSRENAFWEQHYALVDEADNAIH